MPSAPPTTRRICVRCQLRYCSQDCQQHYWRSGHQENCEIIHRGGDEQYHAEKKYKWAVAVAVKACAEDTTGQRCYICFESDARPAKKPRYVEDVEHDANEDAWAAADLEEELFA